MDSQSLAKYFSLKWEIYHSSAFEDYVRERYGKAHIGPAPFKYLLIIEAAGGDIELNRIDGKATRFWHVSNSGMFECGPCLYDWVDDGRNFSQMALLNFFHQGEFVLATESLGAGLAQRLLYQLKREQGRWFITESRLLWSWPSMNRVISTSWTPITWD